MRGARPLALQRGQTLAALTPAPPEGDHLLLVTALGEVKRCEARSLASRRPRARRPTTCPRATACSPSSRTGRATTRSCSRATGKALRLALDGIRTVKTASAGGVAGMRLERQDEVVGRHARPGRRAAAGAAPPRRGQGRAGRRVPRQGARDGRRRERLGRHAQALARRPRAHRDRRAAGRRGAGRDARRAPRIRARPGRAGAVDARDGLAYRSADGRRSRGGRQRCGYHDLHVRPVPASATCTCPAATRRATARCWRRPSTWRAST